MDRSINPYCDLDLDELAQACGERAGELQARAWRNEDERNALREATAELLAAVASQLAAGAHTTGASTCAADAHARLLSASELLEITANNVTHQSLHTGAHVSFGGTRHTWIDDFVPGGEAASDT